METQADLETNNSGAGTSARPPRWWLGGLAAALAVCARGLRASEGPFPAPPAPRRAHRKEDDGALCGALSAGTHSLPAAPSALRARLQECSPRHYSVPPKATFPQRPSLAIQPKEHIPFNSP